MMPDRVMVAIVDRTDTPLSPEHVCAGCKHFVRLDVQAEVALGSGGRALCIVCARDLEQRFPGTFTDENLAKLPPPDMDLAAYPSSKPA